MFDPKEEPKQTNELSEENLEKVTGGAVEIFLQLDGIKGESQEKNRENE